jgi:hypothetical protein
MNETSIYTNKKFVKICEIYEGKYREKLRAIKPKEIKKI